MQYISKLLNTSDGCSTGSSKSCSICLLFVMLFIQHGAPMLKIAFPKVLLHAQQLVPHLLLFLGQGPVSRQELLYVLTSPITERGIQCFQRLGLYSEVLKKIAIWYPPRAALKISFHLLHEHPSFVQEPSIIAARFGSSRKCAAEYM